MNKVSIISLLFVTILICNSCKKKEDNIQLLKAQNFISTLDGKKVSLYTLKNRNGAIAQFTNYGARWLSMWVQDKNGIFADVVLGFDSLIQYRNAGEKYHGAIVGRTCGRIDEGLFTLNGTTYKLANNDGFGEPVRNNLHGGKKGYHDVVWETNQSKNNKDEETIVFTYFSKDGEEGFPGNLLVKVVYTLTDDNAIKIEYLATSDKPTPVNLTNHAFFNLSGDMSTDVLKQNLTILADSFIECNRFLIPTGKILPVKGTPLDFTKPTPVGQHINDESDQVFKGKGFATAYVVCKDTSAFKKVAVLEDPVSGRTLEVFSNQQGLQLYNAWLFNGTDVGKGNCKYFANTGLVLETQNHPDAPNHSNFPSIILQPGHRYYHKAIYKFGVKTIETK